MRIALTEKKSGEIEFEIIYGSIAVMAMVAARYLPIMDMVPICAFKAYTGIPCPTCGTTRSLVHLAYGDIASSLILNPLFSLAMISALILFFASLARFSFNLSRLTLTHTRREGLLLRAGIAAFFLANWMYLIVSL
jgi:hypothetical protein